MPYQSLHDHPARSDHRVPRQGNTGNLGSAVYEWPQPGEVQGSRRFSELSCPCLRLQKTRAVFLP